MLGYLVLALSLTRYAGFRVVRILVGIFVGTGWPLLLSLTGGSLASPYMAPALCAWAGVIVMIVRPPRPKPLGVPVCASCSYNLTGNVSGICPECGTPLPEEALRN